MREAFLERIRLEETTGFVDYLTLSTSLLFSGKYAQNMEELEGLYFYNKIRQSDYRCDGYLDGLEVVCYDYKELADTYGVFPGVVFLVDPPIWERISVHTRWTGSWRITWMSCWY